jgi:hypothetical protein
MRIAEWRNGMFELLIRSRESGVTLFLYAYIGALGYVALSLIERVGKLRKERATTSRKCAGDGETGSE